MTKTKIDELFKSIEENKKVFVHKEAKRLEIPSESVSTIARYLERLGLVDLDFKHVGGPAIIYKKSPEHPFRDVSESEIISKLRFYKSIEDIESANKLVYSLYEHAKKVDEKHITAIYLKVKDEYSELFLKKYVGSKQTVENPITKVDSYDFDVESINIKVDIIKQELEAVPFYVMSLLKLSDVSNMVVEAITDEVIGDITLSLSFKTPDQEMVAKSNYEKRITSIMEIVFPDFKEKNILQKIADYIIITNLGMGEVEFLLKDSLLEEIVINSVNEPVWVYHKKHGWLQTNIIVDEESKTLHYAMLAGRVVDKTITTLEPLMDAHLNTGDRVNATLKPITSQGNTITIRKFAEQPWTITNFIKTNTMDYYVSAMVWTAIQYELSILIVGGTGSGKTSTLNVFSLFIPPNQRVISIEDTRELRLPKTLHWVPMETKLPNPEGKGGVTMLDLAVNSLRMRPDRIIVGEIRRKKEAEVMFEAMHTGHSVYATLHANTAREAITRLTTEPIGISRSLLSTVDLIFVQNRNRRTNQRRTFEVAEVGEDANLNVLFQYSFKKDALVRVNAPLSYYKSLELVSGLTKQEVDSEIEDKIKILKYLVEKNITGVNDIALIVKNYYVNKDYLMKKLFGGKNK